MVLKECRVEAIADTSGALTCSSLCSSTRLACSCSVMSTTCTHRAQMRSVEGHTLTSVSRSASEAQIGGMQ